ncbi:hypothetical protein [Myceligenerans xiligouense]|uniref:Uncharacterized protein n=1 Tax=Myceligenerans xiligouense TaxID=253184 RepID=A0A3N4YNM5_9MICO|nr:hypothetical protein [Myceligenerans xiligouense]RPF21056.1 hypothetical protein EDD34_1666 [Myceligenerans xiligouense]
MMTEAGESQSNGSDVEAEGEGEQTESGPAWAEPVDESLASYARIAPRLRKRRPTRSEVLGGGDATKAPKNLGIGELRPITGDSSGVSWDDPEEL